MKNYVTPHCHIQSLDSASTPEAFAEREVELASGAITVTDHGWLGAVPKVYELAKKNKLTPILGVEAYFRDDDCPILLEHGISKADDPDYKKAVAEAEAKSKPVDRKPTTTHYNKYYHTCIHCKTEAAYMRLVKEISNSFDGHAERHGSELKPLFDWAAMERICGDGDTTLTSGCLIGVVQRHLMKGKPDIAKAYYERMRSLVKPGDFYVEAFPHRCTHYWEQAVYIETADGRTLQFKQGKTLRVCAEGKPDIEIKALELVAALKGLMAGGAPVKLLATKHYQKWTDVGQETVITGIRNVEEFVQNECTPETPDGDIQKPANEFVLALARKYGDKILISDDAHFAKPESKLVQDSKLTSGHGSWKFHNSYHRQSSDDAFKHFKSTLGVSEREFESWIDNSVEFREKFKDFKFKPKIHLPSNRYPTDTVGHLKTLIDKHGRMDWSNTAMVERLVEEVQLLHDNGTLDLLPYFFLAEEVIDVYRRRGELAGVGRGSSGGVLINYLLGVTHMDPLKWGLSLARFITLDRIKSGKLPDVDMDLPNLDIMKDPEKGWLKTEFGDRAAAIATKTGLRLKSSIKDVFRSKFGKVPPDIEALCRKIPNPPQGVGDEDWVFGYLSDDGKEVEGFLSQSEELQAFVDRFPEEWRTVRGMLGIHRSFSRHASAWVLADCPISDFLPTFHISGYRTTQYDMVGVEAQGGLKMDFLGLLTIDIIGEALRLVRERQGYDSPDPVMIGGVQCWPHEVLPWKGKLYWIWALPDDQQVFHEICAGRTETVFQLNTHAAQKWLAEFNHWKDRKNGLKSISSVMDIANFTALDRPGPLDAYVTDDDSGEQHNMLQEYARRARGMKPIGNIPALDELLPETHGVLVMQEGLEFVYKTLTGCSGSEATEFRGNIAKKKQDKVEAAYPGFMERASAKIGKEDAQRVWEQIVTFGQYGFNKSHSVAYSITAYACAWLMKHYNLEWWTAILRMTDKKKIFDKHWKYCRHLIDSPNISRGGDKFTIDGAVNRIVAPLDFLNGVGPKAHAELVAGMPYVSLEDFCRKVHETKRASATKSPKTGKLTGGRSQLGPGVVYKLIISGAMDGFFAPDQPLAEKLYEYEQQTALTQGKKAGKVNEVYLKLDPISQYQLKKQIFPVAFESPMEVFINRAGTSDLIEVKPTDGDGHMCLPRGDFEHELVRRGLHPGPGGFFIVDGVGIKNFNEMPWHSEAGKLLVLAMLYVSESKSFQYQNNTKTAHKMVLDVAGEGQEFVAWPDKTGKPRFDNPGKGSIVLAVLSRRDERPASLEYAYVFRGPFTLKEDKDDAEGNPGKNSTGAGDGGEAAEAV